MSPVAPSEKPLGLRPAELASADAALGIYEQAFARRPATLRPIALAVWTVFGLAGLIVLAWAEPWSARLFSSLRAHGAPGWLLDYVLGPSVMAARGVLAVEAFGYAYHRFFQHLGWLTRRALVFRRNQRYHWMHHMILYPIGRFYKRALPYVASETGIAWSWFAPAALAIALALATMGPRLGTYVFMAAIAAYAKLVVDTVHSRFHEASHPWQGVPYFHWLEDIHILHHWDQRMNFTIVHPLMDALFGTYLSPGTHRREIQTALDDMELTVSDLVNWRYLLVEATPAEYAAFISEAKRHPRSLRKLGRLLAVLAHRLARFPQDLEAQDLRRRAAELLAVVKPA